MRLRKNDQSIGIYEDQVETNSSPPFPLIKGRIQLGKLGPTKGYGESP